MAAPAPAAQTLYGPSFAPGSYYESVLYRLLGPRSPNRIGWYLPAVDVNSIKFAYEERKGIKTTYEEIRLCATSVEVTDKNAWPPVFFSHPTILDPRYAVVHWLGNMLAEFLRLPPETTKFPECPLDDLLRNLVPNGYCRAIAPNTLEYNIPSSVHPCSPALHTKKRLLDPANNALKEDDVNAFENSLRFTAYGELDAPGPDGLAYGPSGTGARCFAKLRELHRAITEFSITCTELARNGNPMLTAPAKDVGFLGKDETIPDAVKRLGPDHPLVQRFVDEVMKLDRSFACDVHESVKSGGIVTYLNTLKPDSAFVECSRGLARKIDNSTKAAKVASLKKELQDVRNMWNGKELVSVQDYLNKDGWTYSELPVYMFEEDTMTLRELSITERIAIDITEWLVSVGLVLVGRPNITPFKKGSPQFTGNVNAQLRAIILLEKLAVNPFRWSGKRKVTATLSADNPEDAALLRMREERAKQRKLEAEAAKVLNEPLPDEEASAPPPLQTPSYEDELDDTYPEEDGAH